MFSILFLKEARVDRKIAKLGNSPLMMVYNLV